MTASVHAAAAISNRSDSIEHVHLVAGVVVEHPDSEGFGLLGSSLPGRVGTSCAQLLMRMQGDLKLFLEKRERLLERA
jgi:hypothetical protein